MLSLQEHVAHRSVERSYRERERGVATWDELCFEVDAAVSPLFAKGRRLRDGDVGRIATAAALAFDRLDPLAVLDHSKAATKGRPRSEEREILCVSPYAGEADGRRHVELCSARIYLSRKRATVESVSTFLRVTTHAMARAIERGVVEAGDEVERRTARCLLDHAGLVVLGRALLGAGDLDWSDTFVLPFDEGLMLGGFAPCDASGRDRLTYDAEGRFPRVIAPSALVTTDPLRGAGRPCAYRAATILGAADLLPTQSRLHAALEAFVSRHRALVNDLGEAMLWPDTAIRTPVRDRAGSDAWHEALAELRILCLDPELRLREGGRPRGHSRAPEAAPVWPLAAQGAIASSAREASSSLVASGSGARFPSTLT